MAELTYDQARIDGMAYALWMEGKAFAPHDEWLPECERMRERGWLARTMVGGDALYSLTPAGVTALEFAGMTTTAAQSVN